MRTAAALLFLLFGSAVGPVAPAPTRQVSPRSDYQPELASSAVIMTHLVQAPSKGSIASRAPGPLGCSVEVEAHAGCYGNFASGYINEGEPEVGYYLYLFAADVPVWSGLRGVSFGIEYDGLHVDDTWFLPSGTAVTTSTWPGTGSGIIIEWAECQNPVDPWDPEGDVGMNLLGLYVYAPPDPGSGIFRTTPHPDTAVRWVSCRGDSLCAYFPCGLAEAGFGVAVEHPCGNGVVLPTLDTTWGRLKFRFGSGR